MFFLLFFSTYLSVLSGNETEPVLLNEKHVYFPSSDEIKENYEQFLYKKVLANEQFIYFPSSEELRIDFENNFYKKGPLGEIVHEMCLYNRFSKNYLKKAKEIATSADLLTPELESLFKAAEAGIYCIAGQSSDPWALKIKDIITAGFNEYKKISNKNQIFYEHLGKAKKYAEEFDRLAIELANLPTEVW